MGKIGAIISDDTEKRLRDYLHETFGHKHYGEFSAFVEEAINLMLDVKNRKKKILDLEVPEVSE